MRANSRDAFAGYAIMAAIAVTATSIVMLPNIKHERINYLVNEIVKKEKLLFDTYNTYYRPAGMHCGGGDRSFTPSNTNNQAGCTTAFIDRAIADGILPAGFDASNGFANDDFLLSIVADGTVITFKIDPDIKGALGQRKYVGYKSSNSLISDQNSTAYALNSYSLDTRESKDIRRQDSINTDRAKRVVDEKIADGTNILTDEQASTNTTEGKEWYEYDKNSDLFAVKEYKNGAWVNKKDENGEKIYKSAGGQGADGKYYVESRDDKNASRAGEGVRLVELNNGEATEYISGRVRKKDSDGNEIDGYELNKDASGNDIAGSYRLQWIALKAETAGMASAEVPLSIDSLNDILNRDSSNNYYNASLGSYTDIKNMFEPNDTVFAKYENFWRTISPVDIPDYIGKDLNSKVEKHIYISEDLDKLPKTDNEDGDIAFLMSNNEAGAGKGYKAQQNIAGKTLYPEAIFYDGKWLYYAPTIGDVLRDGHNSFEYITEVALYKLSAGGFKDSYQWRNGGNSTETILVTKGSRTHFDNIENYKDSTYFLTVIDDTNGSGVASTFDYDSSKKLYVWVYDDSNATGTINSLKKP